jgi:translation initiation factor 3 subunit I
MTLDSNRLITASADQTLRIWDLPTGQELHQIRMNEPCRACTLAVGEELLAFSTDSFMGAPPQIHLVDLDLIEFGEHQGSAPKASINCPKGRVTRVYFTDCNRTLISSHDGGFVSIS